MKWWKLGIGVPVVVITVGMVYWATQHFLFPDWPPPKVILRECDRFPYGHLDVPEIAQEEINWCWAASAQMIMDFEMNVQDQANSPYRQREQANKAFGIDCSNDPLACNFGGWPRFQDFNFHAHNTLDQNPFKRFGNIEWNELKNQICAGHPVAFSIWYGGDTDSVGKKNGHMMVANGYAFVRFPEDPSVPEDRYQEKHVEFINPCDNQGGDSDSGCVTGRGFMSFDLQFVHDSSGSYPPVTNPTDIPSGDGYLHWRDYYNIYFDRRPSWLKEVPFLNPASKQ